MVREEIADHERQRQVVGHVISLDPLVVRLLSGDDVRPSLQAVGAAPALRQKVYVHRNGLRWVLGGPVEAGGLQTGGAAHDHDGTYAGLIHGHDGVDITAGTVPVERLPRGMYRIASLGPESGNEHRVRFTNIPPTYAHLWLFGHVEHQTALVGFEPVYVRFNDNASGTNYRLVKWFGAGGVTNPAVGFDAFDRFQFNAGNDYGMLDMLIYGYSEDSNALYEKPVRLHAGASFGDLDGQNDQRIAIGGWQSTLDNNGIIDTIEVRLDQTSKTLQATTRLHLYGIGLQGDH